MATKQLLIGIHFLTWGALILLALLITQSAPYELPKNEVYWVRVIPFYFLVWLFFGGIASLLFAWVRRKTIPEKMGLTTTLVSFRQGMLLGLIVVILLVLQSLRMLTWWDGALAASAVMMVELFILVNS